MQTEAVNHPAHYQGLNGLEVVDIVERYGILSSWHIADALVYLMRADKKGNRDEDVAKACWYLQRWLDDPNETATFPMPEDDDERPTPEQVVEGFGLKGNIAIAVTYILYWSQELEASEVGIEKALQALQAGV